jgi:hypothetical protein
MSTRWAVTFDCGQPAALAAFWRLALGYAEANRMAARSVPVVVGG